MSKLGFNCLITTKSLLLPYVSSYRGQVAYILALVQLCQQIFPWDEPLIFPKPKSTLLPLRELNRMPSRVLLLHGDYSKCLKAGKNAEIT